MIDAILFILILPLFVISFALLKKFDRLEKNLDENESLGIDRRNNLECRIVDLERELNGHSSIWTNEPFLGVRQKLENLKEEINKQRALLNEVIDEVYRDNK